MIVILFLMICLLIYIAYKSIGWVLGGCSSSSKPKISFDENDFDEYNNTVIYEDNSKQDTDIQKIQIVEEKIDVDKLQGEGAKQLIYRPTTFEGFIGQKRSKEIIKLAISSAKARGAPIPHILLFATAGQGKTTLAQIIAKESKLAITERIAGSFKTPNDIIDAIAETGKNNVLFVDEVHGLQPLSLVEFLYPAIEDFKIHGTNIIPFTLIGATTEKGIMIQREKPLVDRFKIQITFEDYTHDELATIIENYSKKLFTDLKIDDNVFKEVSTKARLTPRIAIRLLETCRDYCLHYKQKELTNEIVKKVMGLYRIYTGGYNYIDLKLLRYLLAQGKPVGLQGLCQYLDTSQSNFINEIEPYLVKTGCIIRTSRGRTISDKGAKLLEHIKTEHELKKEE